MKKKQPEVSVGKQQSPFNKERNFDQSSFIGFPSGRKRNSNTNESMISGISGVSKPSKLMKKAGALNNPMRKFEIDYYNHIQNTESHQVHQVKLELPENQDNSIDQTEVD